MKVFIVEDDPIIVEGLKIALAQENYEVDSYGNMTDAINAINSEAHYDVCLLDVNLPDGDGYQVCKAIREKSDVPIIFLTACDDEIHTVLALEQRNFAAEFRVCLRRSQRSKYAHYERRMFPCPSKRRIVAPPSACRLPRAAR